MPGWSLINCAHAAVAVACNLLNSCSNSSDDGVSDSLEALNPTTIAIEMSVINMRSTAPRMRTLEISG